jgi:polysaccharide biosynthesis transport protein
LDQQPATDTLDLRDYIAVLRRRRWIVVQALAVVVAVAVGVTMLQDPRYEARAQLLVEPAATGDDAVLQQALFGQRELETQKELVTSRPVAEIVAAELGGDIDDLLERVTVTLVRDTQILELRATSTDAEGAAATAQGFAEAYLEYRGQQAVERVLAATDALATREERARERLDEIDRELLRATGSDEVALQREADRLQTELASVSATRLALTSSSDLARGAGQIVLPAEVPGAPFSPKPLRTAVLALVLGAMLGVGLAFLRDFLDDAIRSEDQAVRASGRTVIGHIPRWRSDREDETRLVSLAEPASPVAESYRSLRTNIRFLTAGRSYRSLLVTSALPGEGKSTTAGNLAVALARAGTRVLLVGADLRRPSMHKAFGIDAAPGLSDVLVGEIDLVDAIKDVGVPNLRVIPSGQVPPNPAELLGSPAMAQLMAELEQIADMVVYDGPPVLAVADALEIGPKVGGTLLVVDLGGTGRNALRAAAERLDGVGIHTSGMVLNNLDPSDGYYGYTYYHSYSSQEPAPASRPGTPADGSSRAPASR